MEPTYTAEVVRFWAVTGLLIGWVGGWLWNSYMIKKHVAFIVKTYIDEIHRQYTYLLNKFGIYKKPNGEWQSHAGETISSGAEVKAYRRSDTES